MAEKTTIPLLTPNEGSDDYSEVYLIHTSFNVSIPKLIHNVRDIVYPCNSNLAALLEYMLRSLMDLLERRRKEA
ncbi:hypothetical protein PVK06_029047 [Gossypium arboreum]|uniref:Uncharacterized protein n=1 Tax=Gossypium arboreum TaxID=29729 RepID=A0ABR0P5K4_GOSAR|nr:hypothetical protein PVK06_029047 [Gossypium arboreum]